MSTNSLLASLYNVNRSPTSRSSSMFTKKQSFFPSNFIITNQKQKLRPASTSKTFKKQFNTQNQIQQWTPLIKTVHKLGAKLKKQYFFFWCRMEALIKSKNLKLQNNKNIDQNKQNLPFLKNQIKNKIIQENQSKKVQNLNNFQQPIKPLPSSQNFLFKNQNLKTDKSLNSTLIQSNISQKTYILKSKDTIVYQLVSNLQAIKHKYSQKYLKPIGFNQILLKYYKIQSIQKLKNINFKQYFTLQKTNVLKKLKNISNLYIKLDLLFNLFKKLNNNKLQQGMHSIKKLYEYKLSIEIKQKKQFKVQIQKIQQKVQKQKQSIKQIKKILKKQKLNHVNKLESIKQQIQQSSEEQNSFRMNLIANISKPFNFFQIRSSTTAVSFIKQDKIIQFKNQITNNYQKQRMKKLSHLYHEETIFQIPDISDITLFNSTINHYVFEKITLKQQKQHLNSIKSQQTERKRQLQQFWQKPLAKHTTSSDMLEKFNSNELKSPKFSKYQSINMQNKTKKSSSCANISLTKINSSANIHKTPISNKRTIDIFSKKNSVENLYKSINSQYQYQTVRNNCNKSPIFNQFQTYQNQHHQNNYNMIYTSNNMLQTKKISDSVKKNSKQKHCITVRIPSEQFKKNKTQNSKQLNKKYIQLNVGSQRKPLLNKKVSISNMLNQGLQDNSSKKYIKAISNSQNNKKKTVVDKQNKNKTSNKQNILTQSSAKKIYSQEAKNELCSQFNTIDPIAIKLKGAQEKNIKYQTRVSKQLFTDKQATKKYQYEQFNNIHSPIFQHIEMSQGSEQFLTQNQTNICNVQSSQLSKQKSNGKLKSIKLRTKLQKIQLNTARKMKIQIQNMINQRKKTSLGMIKF